MFGKKSKLSETQKFVIAKGREVGNLKAPGAPFNKKTPMTLGEERKAGKPQGAAPWPSNRKAVGKTKDSMQ